MASTANGIDSVIVISKQSAQGSKAAAGGSQIYPRVTATFDTEADKYAGAEIDASQQQGDTQAVNDLAAASGEAGQQGQDVNARMRDSEQVMRAQAEADGRSCGRKCRFSALRRRWHVIPSACIGDVHRKIFRYWPQRIGKRHGKYVG